MRNSDSWHERRIPPLGTRVYDCQDMRHVGRLDAIISSVWAVVTWEESGFKSHIPVQRLCIADD